MNASTALPSARDFKNHDIVDDISRPGVKYELRPAKRLRLSVRGSTRGMRAL